MKICIQCGATFEPVYANTKLCSDKCRNERNRQKLAKWRNDHREEEKIRKRLAYEASKRVAAPIVRAKHTLDTSIAECRALGYGYNYGQYMTDKHFGRLGVR